MLSGILALPSRRAIRRSSACSTATTTEQDFAMLDGSIRDGKHVMQVRVYYEDTDFSDPPLL